MKVGKLVGFVNTAFPFVCQQSEFYRFKLKKSTGMLHQKFESRLRMLEVPDSEIELTGKQSEL